MSETSSAQSRNHYEVLQLPRPDGTTSPLSKDLVKAAFRRALLAHHPDKAGSRTPPPADLQRASQPLYSVDDIRTAYDVLSDPIQRAAYDETLKRNENPAVRRHRATSDRGTHAGVEVYDLEDLDHHEAERRWSRNCRCGNEQGYVVTESDLEKESEHGEIYIGCRGCSLFIKVLFGVAEE